MSAVYVAADLEPDPRGFGTHQQLGLPECVFRQVSGFNCPHCGMTTSVSHLFRRNLKASVRANPMGLVIIPLMGVFVVAMFLSSVTGIRLKILQFENVLRVVVIFLLVSILIWSLRTLHG
ncbi:MAG: DUF2752 domain-containing protein [Planctomycetaceae bacterium]